MKLIHTSVRLQHIVHRQKLNISDHPRALAASTCHEIVSGKPTYCILHFGALAASALPGIVSGITTYSIPYPGPVQPSVWCSTVVIVQSRCRHFEALSVKFHDRNTKSNPKRYTLVRTLQPISNEFLTKHVFLLADTYVWPNSGPRNFRHNTVRRCLSYLRGIGYEGKNGRRHEYAHAVSIRRK